MLHSSFVSPMPLSAVTDCHNEGNIIVFTPLGPRNRNPSFQNGRSTPGNRSAVFGSMKSTVVSSEAHLVSTATAFLRYHSRFLGFGSGCLFSDILSPFQQKAQPCGWAFAFAL